MVLVNLQARGSVLKFHRHGPVTTLTNSWGKARPPMPASHTYIQAKRFMKNVKATGRKDSNVLGRL